MDVDFGSVEMARDPYPTLEEIRAQGPLVWNGKMNTWMATSDAHCRRILSDYRCFGIEGTFEAQLFGADAFISMDDKARHDQLRGVWSESFKPPSLETLRLIIADVAQGLLGAVEDRLHDGEVVDIIGAFSRDLPAYVILQMLGLPREMHPSIVKWSDDMGDATSAGDDYESPKWRAGERAKLELSDYLLGEIRDRRGDPRDGLISEMVNSGVGETLSDGELLQNCRQLLFAGNETTAKWIAQAIAVFSNHPKARQEVVENRSILPKALEEVMRWESVTQGGPRLVRGNMELAGVELTDGDQLFVLVGAANRDPDKYEQPLSFDIYRALKPHLSFGVGMHNCLGAGLARLEAKIAMSSFFDRFPNYQTVGEVKYGGFILRGPSSLSIQLT